MREVVKDLVKRFIQDIDDGCTVMKNNEVQDFILNTTSEEITEIGKLVIDKIIAESDTIYKIENIILNRVDKYLHEIVKEKIEDNGIEK